MSPAMSPAVSPAVSPASLWDELVTAALMGTERRPWSGLSTVEALSDVVGTGEDLLTVASAVWAYREAGRSPLDGPVPPVPPTPEDSRPLLPTSAARSLGLVLADRRFKPLLGEWLALAAEHGGRPAAELVPSLLDATPPEHRAVLLAVVGPLATWLAARNPDWSWVDSVRRAGTGHDKLLGLDSVEDMAGAWPGADDERVEAFAGLRAANPAAGRRLAERVWGHEPAATRASLVCAFRAGLSMDDEAFLEARLDDRRADVRHAAADLLTRLPESRLAARMRERASRLVRMNEDRLRPSLSMGRPPVIDEGAVRDGVGSVPGAAGAGRRVDASPLGVVGQVVAATPLGTWPAQLGRPPAELVRMAVVAQANELVAGWEAAAIAQGDAEWARALLSGRPDVAPGLVAVLPPAEADAFVLRLAHDVTLLRTVALVRGQPAPWSAALTEAVLEALRWTVASGDLGGAVPVRQTLPFLAQAADPRQAGAADAIIATIEELPPSKRSEARSFWGRAVMEMVAVLYFRQAMHEEFR
jgi:hypothetical protein